MMCVLYCYKSILCKTYKILFMDDNELYLGKGSFRFPRNVCKSEPQIVAALIFPNISPSLIFGNSACSVDRSGSAAGPWKTTLSPYAKLGLCSICVFIVAKKAFSIRRTCRRSNMVWIWFVLNTCRVVTCDVDCISWLQCVSARVACFKLVFQMSCNLWELFGCH